MRITKSILLIFLLLFSCSTHKELNFNVLADIPDIVDQIEKTRQLLIHHRLIDSIKIYGINNYNPLHDIHVDEKQATRFKIPEAEINRFVDSLHPIEYNNDIHGMTMLSSTGENIPVSAFMNFVVKPGFVLPEIYIPDTTVPYIIYDKEISLVIYCKKVNANTVQDTLQHYLNYVK